VRFPEEALLHFHTAYSLAGLLALRGRRVIATFHNQRIAELTRGGSTLREKVGRGLGRFSLPRIPHVIGVSDQAKRNLIAEGVKAERIDVINAYLSPAETERAHPDSVALVSDLKQRYPLLATANAWAPRKIDGADLYGLDLCIGLLDRLRSSQPEMGLVLAVPQAKDNDYVHELMQRIEDLDLGDRVVWLFEPGAYHPIFAQCDLFLRPTNTHGFAISVVEAFHDDLPGVASNVGRRPEGCVLVENRDLDDFARAVSETLAARSLWSERSHNAREPDHYSEIMNVYEGVL